MDDIPYWPVPVRVACRILVASTKDYRRVVVKTARGDEHKTIPVEYCEDKTALGKPGFFRAYLVLGDAGEPRVLFPDGTHLNVPESELQMLVRGHGQ